MSEYKCFSCNRIIPPEQIKKKVRCIYCGSKMIFKSSATVTKVKAR